MLLKNYKSEESGNVGVMFGVSLLAIAGITGAALDYGSLIKTKSQLQSQVDAAVLAAVSVGLREEDGYDGTRASEERIRKEVALQVMKGNGFDIELSDPTVTLTDNNTIFARAEVDHQLAFGGILGPKSINVSAESESGLGTGSSLQIALVLDTTASMNSGGKLNTLKAAARDFIDAIEARGDDSEIALVPFARYVGIPLADYTAPWLELPEEFDTTFTYQQATHSGGECHKETRTRVRDGFEEEYETTICTERTTTYETKERTIESRFKGCVGTRPPPYSEMDEAYVHRVPGLLDSIPYQRTGLSYNVTGYCGREIIPMTDDYDALTAQVNRLHAVGQTYLPTGLLWGQAVLSPGEPFDNPATDKAVDKVMVLMTDGRNSSQIQEGQAAEDAYRAPPYIGTSQEEGEYSPDANEATARMCDNVKADGVRIFTIALQVDDAETIALLAACASDESMAFTAESNDALIVRFNHISGSLEGNARLMR